MFPGFGRHDAADAGGQNDSYGQASLDEQNPVFLLRKPVERIGLGILHSRIETMIRKQPDQAPQVAAGNETRDAQRLLSQSLDGPYVERFKNGIDAYPVAILQDLRESDRGAVAQDQVDFVDRNAGMAEQFGNRDILLKRDGKDPLAFLRGKVIVQLLVESQLDRRCHALEYPSNQDGGTGEARMNIFRLDGRLVLVTGASKGIGHGIATAMAEAGADLILVSRRESELEDAAAKLRASGRSAAIAPFDLRQTDKIAAWYDDVVDRYGCPDTLVNAAGVMHRAPAHEMALEDWEETLAVNLSAVFVLSQAFARECIACGQEGRIINIASLMTVASRRTTAAYTASKGGIGQLTKALAVDWAEHGIHVNAIAPGYIATGLTEPLWRDSEFDSWVTKRCPLGRWGTPEDIGWPAVFLASAAADYITGQILFVDGGWLATF